MDIKGIFEFISAHCGNVVAWLLILWPFVHLALLIQTFSRTVFNEVLWLIDMGLGGKGQCHSDKNYLHKTIPTSTNILKPLNNLLRHTNWNHTICSCCRYLHNSYYRY